MSTIRDRRKHQNRVEAIAEALDSNHDTTTSAPHAVTSAGVSSAENTADSESLSEDNSTDQDLDLHKGADGHNLPLCSRCNDIKDIFDFKKGIPARSWRTLELSACVYDLYSSSTNEPWKDREHFWKVTRHVSKTCPFCSFLMDCASRMAIHSADAVDLESNDWFLALAARGLTCWIRRANPLSKGYYMEGSSTSILKLNLCRNSETQNPFKSCDGAMDWKDTHLILPAQAYDDRHSEISDTIDWELIKEWLDMCQEGHDDGYCNDLATTPCEDIPNFCVIDCETEMIIPAAEISHPDYVTLSYVWGASTTSPQMLDAITSLPVLPDSNQRPNVVNDAMKAVQRIGYRYLWVDRYCIPQSDHDAKSIQIKNMGRIYSMSVLTIIAAAGNDAEYGLPGVRSRPTVQPLWTTVRRGNSAIPVIYFEPPHQDILSSTWNSRGWTYQEALLSRKRLVFTDRHVYFQCESIQSIRTPGYEVHPYIDEGCGVFPYRMSYEKESWENSMWDIINGYGKRTLSFEQDTIHAVQGILESFRDKCYVWFFYGLPIMDCSSVSCPSDIGVSKNHSTVFTTGTFWKINYETQRMLESLLWTEFWDTGVTLPPTRETGFSDQVNLRRMRIPSWTWAGWETNHRVKIRGGAGIDTNGDYDKYYVPDGFPFKIWVSYDGQRLAWLQDNQEIQCRSENNSVFPDFLIISGPVFDVSMSCTKAEYQRTTGHLTGPLVWKYTSPPFLADWTYKGPPYPIDGVGGNMTNLVALCIFSEVCLVMFDLHMLLLRPVGEDTHGQIYERVACDVLELPGDLDLKLTDINLRQMELRIR